MNTKQIGLIIVIIF